MEPIANLSWVLREHCAGGPLPPTLAAIPAVSTKPVARRCLLEKSVQIHASFFFPPATQLARQLEQERTKVVCNNTQARKRPAQRYSRNGPWT